MPFTYGKCHDIVALMTTMLTVDKAGRVVLPKPVRDELQLSPGDSLELESSEERIVLRPVRGTGPLRKKQGIWVFRTGEPLSTAAVNQAITATRRDREREILTGNSQMQNRNDARSGSSAKPNRKSARTR
jgi:AbrB family looped-hinge helix DNA binding protein